MDKGVRILQLDHSYDRVNFEGRDDHGDDGSLGAGKTTHRIDKGLAMRDIEEKDFAKLRHRSNDLELDFLVTDINKINDEGRDEEIDDGEHNAADNRSHAIALPVIDETGEDGVKEQGDDIDASRVFADRSVFT